MGRLFGTDGVRGIANTELSCNLAYDLGRAGAYVLTERAQHKPTILVGRDTRISGEMLEAAIISGICAAGANVVRLGILPTPGIAYLTRLQEVDAGVVISASHNTFEYNGIKFFDCNGYKLPDAMEDRIESIILDNSEEVPLPIGGDIGRVRDARDAMYHYMAFLEGATTSRFDGLRIAVDCANGANSIIAPRMLARLGAQIVVRHNTPDGLNINHNCGSTHPQALQELVISQGADIGLAFDGDADRLITVDAHGRIVDGDQVMVICAQHMQSRGELKKNTLVTTVMSNMGLDIALRENGIDSIKTVVGDRYVLEAMIENGCNLGGEQSGHIIFSDYNTTGDGLLTAIKLISVMVETGQPLHRLKRIMTVLPQYICNASVTDPQQRKNYAQDSVLADEINKISDKYQNNGRVFIRPSGTEPVIRVMIEGPDAATVERDAKALAALFEERLNNA